MYRHITHDDVFNGKLAKERDGLSALFGMGRISSADKDKQEKLLDHAEKLLDAGKASCCEICGRHLPLVGRVARH